MQVEVEPNDKLGVIVEPIHDLLSVTVPDQRAHIVGATGEDVCMVRAKFDSAHRKRVLR